jgi:predicted RNase H-like HicB family nuclease
LTPESDSESEAGFQTMTKYEVIIYWSDEDEAFTAEVPELPGCVAHGVTQEDALGSAQDAIRLWIETAREFGDPIPEPKGWRLILA